MNQRFTLACTSCHQGEPITTLGPANFPIQSYIYIYTIYIYIYIYLFYINSSSNTALG